MSLTKCIPIFGSKPPCSYPSRFSERYHAVHTARRNLSREISSGEFVYHEDSNDEDEINMTLRNTLDYSYNFVDYVRSREYGMRQYRIVRPYHGTRHMLTHKLFREHYVPLSMMNSIFCSLWLDRKQILFGTKCNKLMIYDVNSHNLNQIPSIKGRMNEIEIQQKGINSLKMNPSKTLLATGGYNSNDIAVYRFPTLEPIALAEGGHTDWIIDIEWLDDEFFVTGSRDTKLALWRVKDQYEEQYDDIGDRIQPAIQFISPLKIKICKMSQEICAVTFNESLKEILALSLNGFMHVWNIEPFRQKFSRKLSKCRDNVCMLMVGDNSLYAVGCRSHMLLLDTRTMHCVKRVPSKHPGSGIKSLSYKEHLMTIGTGAGVLLFFDIRNLKYLESGVNRSATLKARKCYSCPDPNFMGDRVELQVEYSPAIYTHCYDHTGTRLFSAGGPLDPNVYGNYASIWQ